MTNSNNTAVLENPATASLSLEGLMAKIEHEAAEQSSEFGHESPAERNRAPKQVLFVLGETHYAIPLANVLELLTMPRITPLPHVPHWLRGVTNLRGEVLSVIDLRLLLGLPMSEATRAQRLIVVQSTSEEVATGWLVDRVAGIRGLDPTELKPCSTLVTDPITSFIVGLAERDGRLLAVLDVNRILASPELRQFEDAR